MNVNDTGDKLFTGVNDTGDKFMTPAINPCHGFSVLAGVVKTGDKVKTGDNDTGEQLLPVTKTPTINLLPVTTTLVIRVCGVSMDASFRGGWNETIGGCVQLRRP